MTPWTPLGTIAIVTRTSLQSLWRRLLWLGVGSYAIVLALIIVSNLLLFDPNWPFGLFASFTPSLLIVFPLVALVSIYLSRWAGLGLIALGGVAFFRFATFNSWVPPPKPRVTGPAASRLR